MRGNGLLIQLKRLAIGDPNQCCSVHLIIPFVLN